MHTDLILILKIMNLPQDPLYATSLCDISRIRIAMTTPRVSFEFFPPKSLEASFRLWDTLGVLAPLDPQFVSVTYGAGGTTRALTHDAVKTIHKHTGVPVAAHLTCVDATRAETLEIARSYAEAGVTEIVALRGDPPKGAGRFTPHPDGFAGSVDLIEALAKTGKFTLRAGAYPDPHPEAATMQDCVDHLKRKIDAGASPPPSPSSSSRPRPSSGSATPAPPRGSPRRSSPASFRSSPGPACANSPRPAAPSIPDLARRGLSTRPSAMAASALLVHRALHRALRDAGGKRRRCAPFLHAQHP
jgi:hypothetical protein